jgi:predicted DNA-binding protein (MmcQ/YjbR family)
MERQEIIDYCLTFPSAYEDYPFDEDWAAMRHATNRRCFAHIFELNGNLCVNVKCHPDNADFLRQAFNNVIPGYHMNKKHWNTIIIGGDVPDDELQNMIVESYEIIKPNQKRVKTYTKKVQTPLISWPENLYRDALSDKFVAMPENPEEAMLFVLSKMQKREKSVVLARFRDNKTFKAISVEHKISSSRGGQIIKKALSLLRHPLRLMYLLPQVDEQIEKPIRDRSYSERRALLVGLYGEDAVKMLESTAVNSYEFRKHVINSLVKAGVETLIEIAILTWQEIISVRYIGENSFVELHVFWKKYGIKI